MAATDGSLPCLIPVVLAGGGGTRFWPVSRGGTPKQCLRLLGDETLLAATLARIAPLADRTPVIVVTEKLASAVRTAADHHRHELVLEPEAKNTAAACALALRHLSAQGVGHQSVVAFFPADHFVGDDAKFQNDLRRAAQVASRTGELVVLGIPPTRPEIGYGYAEVGARRDDGSFAVSRFHEKPDVATAAKYLASSRFYWNAGIFVATMETFVSELAAHAPALWEALGSDDATRAYPRLPSVPFDVALVEKTQRRALVEASFPWSDVGTWSAVAEALADRGDDAGNLRLGGGKGAVLFEDSRHCVVSHETLAAVAVLGLENVVVAERDGRLLVAALDASQRVKDVAAKIEKS